MPRFTQAGATGEGSALIDSGNTHGLLQVAIGNVVVTSAKVRLIYNVLPKYVQFGGQVLTGNPDPTTPVVEETFPVHWQPDQNFTPNVNILVSGIFWKLPLGVSLDITVEW